MNNEFFIIVEFVMVLFQLILLRVMILTALNSSLWKTKFSAQKGDGVGVGSGVSLCIRLKTK